MNAPSQFVIAGTQSGSGKTTLAMAIMAALVRRGLSVQPFKTGPDFIDPTFHTAVTGNVCRNLDGWMLSQATVRSLFHRYAGNAGAAVVEGAMGLFDGQSPESLAGTTAEIALWLTLPVFLVVDASAMAGSIAPLARGFASFCPHLNVAGIIANRVGSPRHADLLRRALEAHHAPPLLGALPSNKEIALPSRHLGLHLARETATEDLVERLADLAEQHLDLDQLLRISRVEPGSHLHVDPPAPSVASNKSLPVRPRIGIAQDEAFCFYYQDNLDLLRDCGAELVEFSPIHDTSIPAGMHGLYLGGGYPELHLNALASNQPMRAAIAAFSEAGAPIYAECGGFMYLSQAIAHTDGFEWPMAGIFPTTARMQSRLAALGYVEVEGALQDGWLAPGQRARGHQFRYSVMDPMPGDVTRAFAPGVEGAALAESFLIRSTLGSYVHLHFHSQPEFARRFVSACAVFAQSEVQSHPHV